MQAPRSIVATLATLAACSFLYLRSGQAQVKELGFSYTAHDGCPNAERFLAGISARTSRVRFTGAPGVEHRLTVKISRQNDDSVGRIELDLPEGTAIRELHDSSCSDVASALALSAALLLDPNASTEEMPIPAGPGASPRSTAPPSVPRERSSTSRVQRDGWGIGVQGELVTAIAPERLIAIAPFVEFSRETGALFAPSLRLSLRHAESGIVDIKGDHARFAWTAARLELCPVRLPPLTDFYARPCAGFGAGALLGAGEGGPSPRSETDLWLDASLLARAGVLLKDLLAIEAQGGALFPITRYDYVFQHPRRVVHRVGGAGVALGVGLGLRFP